MSRPSRLTLAALAAAATSAAASSATAASPYHVAKTAAAPLDVVVEPDDGGGTMHYADRVTMRGPSGAARVLATGAEAAEKGGALLPLFEREIELPGDPSAVVLLGWSSTGAGMETVHAWIVRARPRGAPAIVDELSWTTDRASAGLVVDLAHGVRLGVPWTFGGAMHDASDWALDAGARHLALADVEKLAFHATAAPFDAYRPPLALPPWGAGTRVAWLAATPRGFRMR